MWCWGDNSTGSLGDGTKIDRLTPVKAGGGTKWKSVSVGHGQTCAQQTDGSLWCWGYNANGELGDGTKVDKTKPVQISK